MSDDAYERFLASKRIVAPTVGIEDHGPISERLFPHQAALTRWALRKGRAAIFADAGLGKSLVQLEWCRHIAEHCNRPVLILAPLSVSHQFVREGATFGYEVNLCSSADDVQEGINCINYGKLHKIDASVFGGVSCDESSILKSMDGATRNTLIERFDATPYKLCATATPAPNDFAELGNTAEFLGVMKRVEMLSMFFIHDSGGGAQTGQWRLKGHGRQAFWRWIASWASMIRRPSDLGFEDGEYNLPPLLQVEHVVPVDQSEVFASGALFAGEARTLNEQRAVRRASIDKRVARAAEIANSIPIDEQCILWCELNDEGDALEKAVYGAVQVAGADDDDVKEKRIIDFVEGRTRCLVSKCSILGFGINLQGCRNVVFAGVTNSHEARYQAIRRCWRFGVRGTVRVHTVLSEAEARVLDNLKRKEREAQEMAEAMVAATREMTREEVFAHRRTEDAYNPCVKMEVPQWLVTEAGARA